MKNYLPKNLVLKALIFGILATLINIIFVIAIPLIVEDPAPPPPVYYFPLVFVGSTIAAYAGCWQNQRDKKSKEGK